MGVISIEDLISLSVHTVTPGKTRCFVDGKQEIGSDLTLKCDAKEGSAPVTYSWEKISGVEKLPPSTSGAIILVGSSVMSAVLQACNAEGYP